MRRLKRVSWADESGYPWNWTSPKSPCARTDLLGTGSRDNSRENLVPICPLCHRVIHQYGKLGPDDATPERIREEWKRWLSFATLAEEASIGHIGQSFRAYVQLNIYHVTIPFVIGKDVTYAAARQGMIAHVLERLDALDDNCPFGARVLFPEFWECTADWIAPKPWEQIAAQAVIDQVRQPMSLRAPVPVVASAGRANLQLDVLARMDRTL